MEFIPPIHYSFYNQLESTVEDNSEEEEHE